MFDVNRIRRDFPLLHKIDQGQLDWVYFDNAATTLKPQSVIDAVTQYLSETPVNIHRGEYDLSFAVSNAYEAARTTVAQFINAQPDEVVFTHGTTSSLNMVAYGLGQILLKPDDVVLLSVAEHASNVLPWFRATKLAGARIEYIDLNDNGSFSLEAFKAALHPKVKVVSLAHISNVLGFILPITAITEMAHAVGAVVVVDGAQSVAHMPTDVKASDVDFLTFSAHKMLGPTGIGALYGKRAWLEQLPPFELGGGSNARFDTSGRLSLRSVPQRFESGTPAIEGALGFKAAIEYLSALDMRAIETVEHELRRYALERLASNDKLEWINRDAPTGILTFNVKGIFAQDVATYLNAQHIAVRTGNHCAKLLVEKIKVPDTVRASLSFYNTRSDVDRLVEALDTITLEKCIDLYL
jgi:cysteine desulfurase/selenocysteine lyase